MNKTGGARQVDDPAEADALLSKILNDVTRVAEGVSLKVSAFKPSLICIPSKSSVKVNPCLDFNCCVCTLAV